MKTKTKYDKSIFVEQMWKGEPNHSKEQLCKRT